MNPLPFEALACPLDSKPLARIGATLRCELGHCFDVAGQGYINLLPVQRKRSLDPGDSKEMVAARQRFLHSNYYAPIAAAVSDAVLANLPAQVQLSCLDAGCGEGYYMRQLAAAAGRARHPLMLLGLDISKWAVLSAAKQEKNATWVVGSNANLPVLPATLDWILCMFGFPVYAEFSRVLKAGGSLLQVDAGPDHLRELREVIYPTIKPAREVAATPPAGFTPVSASTVRYEFLLTGREQIADLLMMTPHLYRATAEGRARAAALSEISLTVDVLITQFKKDEKN